jgi:hypothetical protein
LYNLQKLYIAIKEKSAFLIFIDTDLIAVFICWEGLQIAAGSLEIETGTQAVDFDAIVLDNTVPNNFRATSVAEVQNIHYLTQEIAQNFQVRSLCSKLKTSLNG